MIRSPLGLRLSSLPASSLKEQAREVAKLGAKGVVLDATGDLAPDRLSESGRRELRHLLRSTELSLIALNLPTRRPYDTFDGLDDRLAKSDRAFALAYELGTRMVLARVGAIPADGDPKKEAFVHSLRELGKRAEHRGIRLAIETGTEPGSVLRAQLEAIGSPGLAASIDPSSLLRLGQDPVTATHDLGIWVVHAYANDATGAGQISLAANPRGFGFPPGVLDWEAYLGALEEIEYRGYLTIWTDNQGDAAANFRAIAARLAQY